MFIEHVYVQYAAEPNLHTIIYEISFGGIWGSVTNSAAVSSLLDWDAQPLVS